VYLCVLCDSHNNTMYFYKQLTSVFTSIEKTLLSVRYAINFNMLECRLGTYKNLSPFDHHIPTLTMENRSTLGNSYRKFWKPKANILTYLFFGKVEILMKTLLKTQSLPGCYAMSTSTQFPTFRRSVLSPLIGMSLNIYKSTRRDIPEIFFCFSFIWRCFRSL
jgi:hypothetical protein